LVRAAQPADKTGPSSNEEVQAKPEVKPSAATPSEVILEEMEKDKPSAPMVLPKDPGGVVQSVRRSGAAGQPGSPDQPNWPDGYVLVDRVGRLVKDGQWWTLVMESEKENKSGARSIRLLPSRMLESMEMAAARGTRDVRFKVSGEVTEYHGVNYLLLRMVLVLRDQPAPAKKPRPTRRPGDARSGVKDSGMPTPEAIIAELEKEKPEAPLTRPKEVARGGTPVPPEAPSVTPSHEEEPLLADGGILVHREGRMVKDGRWWTLAFRSDENRTVRERPVRLLPSRMLENMEIAAARLGRNVVFQVSGELTKPEDEGINYLLLRKVLIAPQRGNLR
jgi:hypothetical protein